MPGTLLRDDWQKAVTDRLQQHAQDTLQAMQQANQPPLQNVQAPSLPNLQIDPNEIIGRLQQHAQDAFQAAQPYNQPPLAGVQVDPNDIIQRLQQHAQDALQSVGQNVQPIAQGLQQLNQPPLAGAPTPAPAVTAGVTPSGQQPIPSAAPIAGAPTAAGGSLEEFARQQAQAAGIDPDIFVRQIQQESGFRPDARSPAGAVGIAQFMPDTARGLGIDPSDPIAALRGAATLMGNYLKQYGGDYAKALAAYNAGPGNVEQYGGVPPFEETQRYVKTILGNAGQAVEGARRSVAGAVLPVLSQFGDRQLNSLEAYAACGPAAAVRFAQMFGRNPTLREAVDLAKNVGWSEGHGMAGLQSESKLFSEMGVPHRVLGADWQAFAREAQSGNPVTLSTAGHYFTADSYDPASGAFHVGSSGTDLRGGSEWMTPAQMEARMGALQGGLVADHPNVPGASPLSSGSTSAPTGPVAAAKDVAGRAIGAGLQVLDSAVRQIGGGARDTLTGAGRVMQQGQDVTTTGDRAVAAPVTRGVGEYASGIQSPQTGNPLLDIPGTARSALWTGAQQLGTGLRNISPTSELSRGALGMEQLVTENRALYDQQQALVDQFVSAQERNDTAEMDRIRQQMADLQAQLPDARDRDVVLAAAERNPGLPLVETGANLAGAGIAAPLAAEGAPLATRALASVIDPATGLPSLAGRGIEALSPARQAAVDADAATRSVLSNRQAGQASLRATTTLGGAAAGGAAGYASTPDDAMTIPTPLGDIPIERIARTVAGTGIGAGVGSAIGGFRGPIDQQVLEHLRQSGLVSGPAVPKPLRGFIPEAVDATKQSILSGPGLVANVIGNTIELGRQPAALWMGGRGDDALAGLASVTGALRKAAGNAQSALEGRQLPALGTGVGSTIPRRAPIYRVLSAADAFTRTLGEHQGMAAEANRLLRDAGMTPSDPGAAAYLASHAADMLGAGARDGAQSVFGQAGSTATARVGLENIFRVYNNFKEGLLNSPDRKLQLTGALLDFEIPFSGIPVRMVQLVAARTPPGAQIRGAVRAAQAIARGDAPAAQRAAGETALESSIQFLIAKNIADGNIRGPGDPEHPNSIRMPGMGWVSMSEWGGYSLPMQVMAAFAEGYQKGGLNIPPSTPGASDLEKYTNYYGPRFNAALNASMKPLVQAIPGANMIRALSTALQGDTTGAGLKLAQDAVNRITVPGAARYLENATDPAARDVAKKGVQSLWEGPMSSWPFLAQLLPEKIDPTTGETLNKARSGAGTLVGVQQDVASPLTIEAARLKNAGYDVTAPKDYPDKISVAGADVNLSPDEQRKVTEITGKQLGALAERLNKPDYLNSTDTRKAQLMQAYMNAVEKARVAAVRDVIGQEQLRQRVIAGQKTAGRLNVEAPPPPASSFSSSSNLSAQEQQAVGAGR